MSSAHLLEQPLGVLDPRHRVGQPLQRRRDCDDLLDGPAQPLPVVVPVHDEPQVWDLALVSCTAMDLIKPTELDFLLRAATRVLTELQLWSLSLRQGWRSCNHAVSIVSGTAVLRREAMVGNSGPRICLSRFGTLSVRDSVHLVRLTCSDVAAPSAQEGARDRRLSAEDGDRHRPLTGRQVVRPLRDDVVAVQALVLEGCRASSCQGADVIIRKPCASVPKWWSNHCTLNQHESAPSYDPALTSALILATRAVHTNSSFGGVQMQRTPHLDALVSQELAKSPSSGDRTALAP